MESFWLRIVSSANSVALKLKLARDCLSDRSVRSEALREMILIAPASDPAAG